MDEHFIKRLITNIKCGVCGHPYNTENINILGHSNDLWFLNVFCPNCHSYGLVAAVIKEGKSPEVITDLSREEYASFKESASVGADDVLDIHEFLEKSSGDILHLLGKG